MEQCHGKWLGNQKNSVAGRVKPVTISLGPQKVSPLELCQIVAKETTTMLFNRDKIEKLTSN